ncbi:MAG TPA: RDD family protein [Acidimicrobiales bacterium]|nr:RDD family protein [Acidimicrobiales bacterium]
MPPPPPDPGVPHGPPPAEQATAPYYQVPYGQPPPHDQVPPYGQAPPYPSYGQPPAYGQPPRYGQAPPYGAYGQIPFGQPPPYGQPPPFGQIPYGYVPVPADRFGRPLADWWQRLVAIIIDGLIIGIPHLIVTLAVVGSSEGGVFGASWRAGVVLTGIAFAVIGIAYFALLNGSERGQTVGQMALGIAVRDEVNGGSIDPPRAALRILVLYPGIVLGWIPILGGVAGLWTLVAGLSPLWDRRRQGFHDKVAHTDVIKVR